MTIDLDTVSRVARLARIAVAPSELAPLAKELSTLLDWVARLEDLNVEGVAPLTSVVAVDLPLREDVIADGFCSKEVLSVAPAHDEEFYFVPKMVSA